MSERRRATRRPTARILAVGLAGCALVVAVTAQIVGPLNESRSRVAEATASDLALREEIGRVQAQLAMWQQFLEPELDKTQQPGAIVEPSAIASGSQMVQNAINSAHTLARHLTAVGLRDRGTALEADTNTLSGSLAKLTPIATGQKIDLADLEGVVAPERDSYAAITQVLNATAQDVTQHRTAADLARATDRMDRVRTLVLGVGAATVLAVLVAALVAGVAAGRRLRRRRIEVQQRFYGTELQQGLELARNEDAVYDVIGRALRDAVPQLDAEMLIADSSRAHFRRVMSTREDPDDDNGCSVVSPRDCPAATRARTMLFESSNAISACPYLRDRPGGSCSAVCLPVSIAGRAVGVLHAAGADHTLPEPSELETLELSARRASERVALLRTFERTETQARTDPLTGLLNRRSLENQVHELQNDGIPYAVAYGDLDQFKKLNDTHGHDAGDRALRVFARVLRDSVRPVDLVCRYGGEEFVIVLPDCTATLAVSVLERVRERLALTLTSGRVPAFSVSFGVSDSSRASTFDEATSRADAALLEAKGAGRNRIVVDADERGPEPLPATGAPDPASTDGGAEPAAARTPTRARRSDHASTL